MDLIVVSCITLGILLLVRTAYIVIDDHCRVPPTFEEIIEPFDHSRDMKILDSMYEDKPINFKDTDESFSEWEPK